MVQLLGLRHPTDFSKLAFEVAKIFDYQSKINHNEIQLVIPEIPILKLDSLRMRQILFNLIGNASKFTKNGKIKVWANYHINDDKNSIDLNFGVSDTGIGISEEDKQKLMQPFVQLNRFRGTNASNTGTGLGLSICKRLAEIMNGEIEITSKIDEGSTFTVKLRDVKISSEESHQEVQHTNEFITANKSLKILLVDDIMLNLSLLHAIFKTLGYTNIKTMTSPELALDLLKKQKYDLVFTDMWMPSLNGIEFAKQIKANPSSSNTKIILITADTEANAEVPSNLFNCMLFKPITKTKISKVLGSLN